MSRGSSLVGDFGRGSKSYLRKFSKIGGWRVVHEANVLTSEK